MDTDLEGIFDHAEDPRRIAEIFQQAFFNEADAEEKNECPHDKIEGCADGRGYCVSCGETFTDSSDVNSVISNCKHEHVHKDDSGIAFCTQCGLELKTLDFHQEWRWYGSSDNRTSRDPSRCHHSRITPKGIQSVFHSHNIEISHAMMDMVEARYKRVTEVEGNKVLRGQGRKSIVAACLFHVYKEMFEFRTSRYIRELFKIEQKNMSLGMTKYYNAFPDARTQHISPESLIPWVMKLTGVDRQHYRRIIAITRYIQATSELLERSNPQSVAAAIIFFYLCLNREYMSKLDITKALFAKKAHLSEITVTKIVHEIAVISCEAIAM